MRTRWGRLYAATGAATLSLLAATATGAHAAPAADPVDVEARQYVDDEITAPGRTFDVRAIADLVKGQAPRLGLTLTLPQGVTYVRTGHDAADAVCTPSVDGRSVKCAAKDGKSDVSAQVVVKVGADVTPGTELRFTTTVDLGDTVDATPENNTATGKVTVRAPADLAMEWKAPSGRTPVGEDVKADLVVTNHGPGPVQLPAVGFDVGWDYRPKDYGKGCWADPGELICEVVRELAPAESATFSLTWKFPKKAAGTKYEVPAFFYSSTPLDTNPSNNKATLVFDIAKASPSSPGPTTKPTPPTTPPASSPTAHPTPSASSAPSSTAPAGGGVQASPQGGGGKLAETGGGPVVAGVATATALVLTGGAAVLLNRGRRRARGSHM
ncbi:hypothetical protein ABZ330_35695 [Streptomyces sp. NPDC006172]|uniref:hypothetical protein n=1 Tax=Streptomyces sp. NPDC006172 TaxID=3154470 RepID=UPI0033EDEAC9